MLPDPRLGAKNRGGFKANGLLGLPTAGGWWSNRAGMENNPIQAKKNKNKKGESESDSVAEALKELGPYMGLGSVLAISTGAGTIGGVYLDRWLGSSPWLTLTGIFLGIGVGFVAVFQTLAAQEKLRRKPGGD